MFNGRSNPKNGACTHARTHAHIYRGVGRYRSSVVINQAAFLPPRNRRHPIGIPSERPFTLHRKQPRLESFSTVPAPFHFHIFVSRSNDRFPRFLSREDLVVLAQVEYPTAPSIERITINYTILEIPPLKYIITRITWFPILTNLPTFHIPIPIPAIK